MKSLLLTFEKAGTCLLSHTLLWFQKAVPTPTSKNIHVQIGCHFEEVSEFTASLTAKDNETQALIDNVKLYTHLLADRLKTNHDCIKSIDRVEALDGLCDQIVTATGAGHMLQMDILGGLHEVNGSNWSKFTNGNPVFDANGKITKGPGYYKANLQPFIG